jgi:hypothetical protein
LQVPIYHKVLRYLGATGNGMPHIAVVQPPQSDLLPTYLHLRFEAPSAVTLGAR